MATKSEDTSVMSHSVDNVNASTGVHSTDPSTIVGTNNHDHSNTFSLKNIPQPDPNTLNFTPVDDTSRKKKLTSVVWQTFTPITTSGLRDGIIDSAKCTICHKIFSTRHGTSSMMRHAKRHVEISSASTSVHGTTIVIGNGNGGKKSKKGNGNSGGRRGSSGTSNHLKKDSLAFLGFDDSMNSTTMNLKRQRINIRQQLAGAIIEWVIEDRVDPRLVLHDKFLDIFTAVGVNARPSLPPTPSGILKTIERKYDQMFIRVSEYLRQSATCRLSFSCDTWSNLTHKNYMVVHLHWINSDWEYRTIQIALEPCPNDFTAYFFAELLYNILQHTWGLGLKLLCGVTPAANDSVLGMGFLREKLKTLVGLDHLNPVAPHWNVACLGHLIHTGVLASFQEINQEIKKLRCLLSLLKSLSCSNTIASTDGAVAPEMLGLSTITNQHFEDVLPTIDSPKEWKTTLSMILESVKMKHIIHALSCSEVEEETVGSTSSGSLHLFALDENEWEILSWSATFLEKCQQMATCQSDRKHIALSTSLNVCMAIIEQCVNTSTSVAEVLGNTSPTATAKIQAVCRHVKSTLETYHTEHSSPYFALAKILDPRFSNESVDKADKKEFLRDMLRKHVYDDSDTGVHREDPAEHSNGANGHPHVNDGSEVSASAYSTFEKLLDIGEGLPEYAIEGDEVDRFFDATLIRDKRSDPFLWWKSNETRFPSLAKLARDILSIPATAIPSGAIFTQATTPRPLNSESMETNKQFKCQELTRIWSSEYHNMPANGAGTARNKRRRESFDYTSVDGPVVSAVGNGTTDINSVGKAIVSPYDATTV